MPEGKPPKGGKPYSAEDRFYEAWEEDKAIRKAMTAKRIKESANMGIRFAKRTFDTFQADREPSAYAKCRAYADSYTDSDRNSLMIIGKCGTGKTHLAAAIANYLLDKGIPVLFDTYSGHLHKLRADMDKDTHYRERMQNIDILILDDVGREKVSEWSQSIMFDIINYRYEHVLPIVVTSNLDTKELADYFGSAVWSRLCEMCIGAKTEGSDYRIDRDK